VLLPTFTNLSGDNAFGYSSYGMTEDIATSLGAFGVLVRLRASAHLVVAQLAFRLCGRRTQMQVILDTYDRFLNYRYYR